MRIRHIVRAVLVLGTLGTLPLAAFADEIVHFTNGAEMTVRSHTVEKAKEMVRLDLGNNSFIAFPMSMVDKIVSAGQDVFLNPVFHPSNQAVAAGNGVAVADTSIRGTGEPAGLVRRPSPKGNTAGAMLGEAADALPATPIGVQPNEPVAASRRIFNPLIPAPPGSAPQVIMPPGAKYRAPVELRQTRPPEAPPAPPPAAENTENQAASDPPTEDPPDTP